MPPANKIMEAREPKLNFKIFLPYMKSVLNHLLLLMVLLGPTVSYGQLDTTGRVMTLEEIISTALKNQPAVKQSLLDEQITDRQIKANLSGWYPQITGSATLLHNIELPVSIFPNVNTGERTAVTIGVYNSSTLSIEARQSIFNNDLFLASRTAKPLRTLYGQNTEAVKISTIVAVSKAYYDVLITQEQYKILEQVRQRQEEQLDDARDLYEGGLVDPTDYKRATIALNNTIADLKRNRETLKAKYAYLAQLMGVGETERFFVKFENDNIQAEMLLDTMVDVNYANRIEMQQLQTQKRLQDLSVSAQKWSLFPTISAYVNRNHLFQNDEFPQLYQTMYPNSQVGVTLSLPIFQGMRRYQNLQQQALVNQRLDQDITNTKNVINTQYEQALALYKSDLNDWKTATENVNLSQEVYSTIKLQYDEGIKTYLDLMIAESDLRTAQLNQLNAVLNVLSSKLDVMQSLGTINTNQ